MDIPEHLSPEAQIKQIFECMDWSRIRKVMKHLKWVWAGYGKTKPRSPTIPEMKAAAKHYLMDAYTAALRTRRFHFAGSGGFMARAEVYDDYPPVLSLSFDIAEFRFEDDTQSDEDFKVDMSNPHIKRNSLAKTLTHRSSR